MSQQSYTQFLEEAQRYDEAQRHEAQLYEEKVKLYDEERSQELQKYWSAENQHNRMVDLSIQKLNFDVEYMNEVVKARDKTILDLKSQLDAANKKIRELTGVPEPEPEAMEGFPGNKVERQVCGAYLKYNTELVDDLEFEDDILQGVPIERQYCCQPIPTPIPMEIFNNGEAITDETLLAVLQNTNQGLHRPSTNNTNFLQTVNNNCSFFGELPQDGEPLENENNCSFFGELPQDGEPLENTESMIDDFNNNCYYTNTGILIGSNGIRVCLDTDEYDAPLRNETIRLI
jgi:hypothetical protein